MALATQCPHCHTVFRVAADQLKLRSGLVRCGACKQIFNGIENLVPQPAATASTAPAKTTTPPSSPEPQVDSQHATPSDPSSHGADTSTTAPAAQSSPLSATGLDFIPVDSAASKPIPPAAEEKEVPQTDVDPLQAVTIMNFFEATEEEQTTEKQELIQQEPSASEEEKPISIEEQPIDAENQSLAEHESATSADEVIDEEHEPPAGDTEISHAEAFDADSPLAAANAQEDAAAEEEEAPVGFDDHDEDIEAESSVETVEIAAVASSPTTATMATEAPSEIPTGTVSHAEESEDSGEEDHYEPSFVTLARRKQRRARVWRAIMGIGSVLLLIGALGQGAYAFRNSLAAWVPQSKPWLTQLCLYTGCQVQLPAQIDMVSIESTELQASTPNKNIFTLTVLLRNRSGVAQAWPDMELTLNDADEKPVVRRVLRPREYLSSKDEFAKGFGPNSEQSIKLNFELLGVNASGYRVYLFYS